MTAAAMGTVTPGGASTCLLAPSFSILSLSKLLTYLGGATHMLGEPFPLAYSPICQSSLKMPSNRHTQSVLQIPQAILNLAMLTIKITHNKTLIIFLGIQIFEICHLSYRLCFLLLQRVIHISFSLFPMRPIHADIPGSLRGVWFPVFATFPSSKTQRRT